ncbi:GGDEF domain-containing protein [Neobacillus drentensis]
MSCGVSYWNKERLDAYHFLFKRADEALYIAKGTGKNKVVIQGNNIMVS